MVKQTDLYARKESVPPTDRNPVQASEAQISRHKAALEQAGPEVRVLLAVADFLAMWEPFEQAIDRLLRDVSEALGQGAGVLWLPRVDVLVPHTIWSAPGVDQKALERAHRHTRRASAGGLAGRARDGRRPIERGRLGTHLPVEERLDAPGGLSATVAVPALAGDEVLAILELYSTSQAEISERLMGVLTAVGNLLGLFFARRRALLQPSPVTARELQVLRLAAEGLRRRMIAEQLSIAPATVKTHLEHIRGKLGVANNTAAVARALRAGLIE
jgi:DNA-binding CsgD family transcriptional regulator